MNNFYIEMLPKEQQHKRNQSQLTSLKGSLSQSKRRGNRDFSMKRQNASGLLTPPDQEKEEKTAVGKDAILPGSKSLKDIIKSMHREIASRPDLGHHHPERLSFDKEKL